MATATCPVVTDATHASDAQLHEACSYFLPGAEGRTFTKCSSGVNNKVYLVHSPGSPDFVVRIYNNGGATARVAAEHALLNSLSTRSFPFAVPRPLPTLRGCGATFVVLPSGAAACVFPRIPGTSVPLTAEAARAIGAATAALVRGMADVDVPTPAVNPLYRNVYDAHHATTRDAFLTAVRGPACDAARADVDALTAAVVDAEERIVPAALAARLPEQAIHADAHLDNWLATPGGSVSACLDFEFHARDWRVMELVVCLSKYAGLSSPEACVEACLQGYGAGGGVLLAEEIALLPDLIRLRVLSNVVYFVGRGIAGEDSFEPLTGRAGVYLKRLAWLDSSRAWLTRVATDALLRGGEGASGGAAP